MKVETVVALKEIALERIDLYAKNGQLLDVPELPSVLCRWRDWGAEGAATRWTKTFTSNVPGLLRLMSTFLSQTKSQSFGDSVGKIRHTLNCKLMSDFIDLEKAAVMLDGIGKDSGLESDHLLAVKTFNEQFPFFREGKDPDSPFVRMGLA